MVFKVTVRSVTLPAFELKGNYVLMKNTVRAGCPGGPLRRRRRHLGALRVDPPSTYPEPSKALFCGCCIMGHMACLWFTFHLCLPFWLYGGAASACVRGTAGRARLRAGEMVLPYPLRSALPCPALHVGHRPGDAPCGAVGTQLKAQPASETLFLAPRARLPQLI